MSSPEVASATAPQTSTAADLAQQVEQIYQKVDALLGSGSVDGIDDETIQRLVTLGVKLYVAKRETGHTFSPFVGDSATATDVSVISMGMLEAVNLDLFELSLWRNWGRV